MPSSCFFVFFFGFDFMAFNFLDDLLVAVAVVTLIELIAIRESSVFTREAGSLTSFSAYIILIKPFMILFTIRYFPMEFYFRSSFWIMSWSDGSKDHLARTLDNNLNPFVDNMLSLSKTSLYCSWHLY